MNKFLIREYMRNYSNYKNNYDYKDIEILKTEEASERKIIELTSKTFQYEISYNTNRYIIKPKIKQSINAKLSFNGNKYLSFLTDIINLCSSNKNPNIKYKKIIRSKIIDSLENTEELIPCLKIKMYTLL